MINYSNPQQEVLGHDESPAPRPLVSNLIVPANAPESLPSTSDSHLDIINLSTITSLSSLSDEQRYHIPTNTGTKLKEYPTNSQKRCFQSHWSELFPWIRYPVSVDGVFCAPCFLFSKTRLNSEYVSTPFRDWKNATGLLVVH